MDIRFKTDAEVMEFYSPKMWYELHVSGDRPAFEKLMYDCAQEFVTVKLRSIMREFLIKETGVDPFPSLPTETAKQNESV